MDIRNLQFFDNNGYNLNFNWVVDRTHRGEEFGHWEGAIYLPKVSVGLYANTSIYVLEEINDSFYFPQGDGKITFYWDRLNKFVDEFFMFDFNETYKLTETSSLVYTPNDGPDCETLIINRFDTYDIPLNNKNVSKALPIHIAFRADEKYDATTYNRTLIMSYNNSVIARIKFYTETVEEDERLKIWNANLGYNITPEDEMIFYKSDIKEYMPDFKLLNEKRKELMLEGSNIYPYIGSYKAIINAIKFFGYDNLNIIEYWRNVNPDDENFGKIYHSSKYSLTKQETLTIGSRNIVLPNKDYKKINSLALVYSINKPTGETDDWELPKVEEQFAYTIEEAIIKLFALRKKLNKEFMPGTSRIIDIIGEANYFGIHGITKINDTSDIKIYETPLNLNFDIYPKKYIHITDNEYFNRYITRTLENVDLRDSILYDIMDMNIADMEGDKPYYDGDSEIPETLELLNNYLKCEWFKKYYNDVFVEHTVHNDIDGYDDYPYDNPEYNYTGDPTTRFTAKVVLSNSTFKDLTFDECDLKFDCIEHTYSGDPDNNYLSEHPLSGETEHIVNFNDISNLNQPDTISWEIRMSKDQVDEDLKNIGVVKEYKYNNEFVIQGSGVISGDNNYNEFFVELPYIGYYDVTMTLGYSDNPQKILKKTKTKCIKVEPYQIELIGFYYDARELPDKLKYDFEKDSELYKFVQEKISNMSAWATAERKSIELLPDFSMPIYSATGEVINPGPYFNNNIEDEWYLADNITFDIAELKPVAKYARYIRNGVDVKPYTWFLLGFEYSKISGKTNPRWSIKNNDTGIEHYFPESEDNTDGKHYLTFLLKKEGNYTVTLTLKDKNGNEYETSRNIIVVDKSANYNIYQTFKKEYDYITEQEMLKRLNEYYADDKEDIEENS